MEQYEVLRKTEIQLISGKSLDPLDPDPDKIDIVDIAHALANQCRFSGHTRFHYSVAYHSVLCAEAALHNWPGYSKTEPELRALARAMLLHDASEAYLVDLPRPLKADPMLGSRFRTVEDSLQKVIAHKYGVDFGMPEVSDIDTRLLFTEKEQLLPYRDWGWTHPSFSADVCKIFEESPSSIRSRFLKLHEELWAPTGV